MWTGVDRTALAPSLPRSEPIHTTSWKSFESRTCVLFVPKAAAPRSQLCILAGLRGRYGWAHTWNGQGVRGVTKNLEESSSVDGGGWDDGRVDHAVLQRQAHPDVGTRGTVRMRVVRGWMAGTAGGCAGQGWDAQAPSTASGGKPKKPRSLSKTPPKSPKSRAEKPHPTTLQIHFTSIEQHWRYRWWETVGDGKCREVGDP